MATVTDFINEWRNDKPYILAHSSGSTGAPKPIRLLKDDMRASARATNMRFGINGDSILALPLSVDYIAGKMMCVRAVEAECALVEMPVSNELVISRPIDLLAIVPSQADSLIANPQWAKMVRNTIVGGAPLSAERALGLIDAGYNNVYSTYGMTETCSHVALADIRDAENVYHAMPGITFMVDNRDCLVIEAPGFSFGRLVTNDVVTLLDTQSFIWRGRYDNVINSGGIKISAEQIEKMLAPYIASEFYVVAYPDDKWGEVPAIVFQGSDSDIETIRCAIAHIPDKRLHPRHIIPLPILPHTANGKIIRKRILKL